MLSTLNSVGETISTTSDAGTSAAATMQYSWSGGLELRTTDADGNVTSDSYNSTLQLTAQETKNSLGTVVDKEAFAYNSAGFMASQMVGVGGPAPETTGYTNDGKGQLLSQTNPAGDSSSTSYDAAGFITWTRDGDGLWTEEAYNGAGLQYGEPVTATPTIMRAGSPPRCRTVSAPSLAGFLLGVLNAYVIPRNLGVVTGADGTVDLMPDLVRIPDLAFINWNRLPGRRRPANPVPNLVPNLVVEVLSRSNTPGEMTAKRLDYFAAGVELVWEIDPVARNVLVYTGPAQSTVLTAADLLDGGVVVPGFSLPVQALFTELDRQG